MFTSFTTMNNNYYHPQASRRTISEKQKRLSSDNVYNIINMYLDLLSRNQIARNLHLSVSTVNKRIRRYELNKPQFPSRERYPITHHEYVQAARWYLYKEKASFVDIVKDLKLKCEASTLKTKLYEKLYLLHTKWK